MVSPQFHVRADTRFQTLRKAFDNGYPKSKWQDKCHFTQEDAQAKQQKQDEDMPPPEGAQILPNESQGTANDSASQGETQDTTSGLLSQHPIAPPQQDSFMPAQNSQVQETPQAMTGLRRSQRQRRPTQRYIEEALAAELSVEQGPYDVAFEVLAVPNNEAEIETMNPLIAMAASADPDTMYWHAAMSQPDRKQFLEAAVKEVNDQTKNGNWEVVHQTEVPSDASILPAVWSMKRKRRIKTHEVYKWKARLNIDGSKQQKGINYWESYAAVCTWAAIRLILVLVVLNNWKTRQIDFVQAYPQAPVEVDNLYMKIRRGFEIEGAAKNEYLLHIKRNIYGQVQAGRVWNKYLVGKLTDIGFKQSMVDESVIFRGNVIYALYTDDSILAGPDDDELDKVIRDMQSTGLELTEEGDLSDFLGVNIDRKADGTVHLTQPQLMDQILHDLQLEGENVSTKQTPSTASRILKRNIHGECHDDSFHYRSVIGRLNYLEKCDRASMRAFFSRPQAGTRKRGQMDWKIPSCYKRQMVDPQAEWQFI